jgi:hypothetical protein
MLSIIPNGKSYEAHPAFWRRSFSLAREKPRGNQVRAVISARTGVLQRSKTALLDRLVDAGE